MIEHAFVWLVENQDLVKEQNSKRAMVTFKINSSVVLLRTRRS